MPQGLAADRFRTELDLMERKVDHLKTAISDMKNALSLGDTTRLASGVMNSRNWTLSVVVSHCYAQSLTGMQAPMSSGRPNTASPFPEFQLDILFRRAIKAGIEDGKRDSHVQGFGAGPFVRPPIISITGVLIGG
jgi:hypothetical protein